VDLRFYFFGLSGGMAVDCDRASFAEAGQGWAQATSTYASTIVPVHLVLAVDCECSIESEGGLLQLTFKKHCAG
jgi:hypothetical protein